MSQFYKGQLVKCVDDSGVTVDEICAGKVYEILEVSAHGNFLTLKGFPLHQWKQSRFIPMDMQSTSPYCKWEMKWKLYG